MGSFPEEYQANTLSKSFGKGVQDSHGWAEPSCQPLIATVGRMQPLDLLMNEGKNGVRRVAVLKLGGKWMLKEIVLCAHFVGLQGNVENWLEFVR